jgi:hypothetical protein
MNQIPFLNQAAHALLLTFLVVVGFFTIRGLLREWKKHNENEAREEAEKCFNDLQEYKKNDWFV